MSHSEIVKLNDVCEFIVDCKHKTAPTQETGYPSIRTPNIGRGRLILENVNRVSEEIYIDWTKRAVPKAGDLILAGEAPVGNVAIIPENIDVCLGQRTVLIRPDKTKVDNGYLLFLLLSDELQGKILSRANGSTVHHLNMKDIRNLELPDLPPLATQQRIAEILSNYDRLIDNNNRRIALLEESIHLLYKEWFVHLRFPGYESVKVVHGIPEGWENSTIGDAFTIMGGGTPSKNIQEYWQDGTITWYSPTDLTKSNTMFMEKSGSQITSVGLANSSARLFPPFSVMMTSRATIGVVSINTTEACTNQGFITCIPNEKIPLYFLYCWIKANAEIFYNLASGATFKEISKGIFKKIPIIIPSAVILNTFEEKEKIYGNLILNLQRENKYLKEARDLLLPRLMNGSIAV